MQLDLPDGATEKEQRRVKQEIDRVERNAKIRDTYPELREAHGRQKAWDILAERHHCSVATVKHVLYRSGG